MSLLGCCISYCCNGHPNGLCTWQAKVFLDRQTGPDGPGFRLLKYLSFYWPHDNGSYEILPHLFFLQVATWVTVLRSLGDMDLFFMYNCSKNSKIDLTYWNLTNPLKIEIKQGSITVGCTPRQLLSRHSDMPSKNWSTTKVSQKEKTPKSSSMWTIHGLSMVDASICR